MIPEPHEPFDINRKEDSIFLLGSMFTVIFLFLLFKEKRLILSINSKKAPARIEQVLFCY